MSFLLAPFVLFALGVLGARVAKAKRVYRRRSRFRLWWGLAVIALAWWVGLALFVGAEWTRGLEAVLPGDGGLDWMVNSGLFGFEAAWPLSRGVAVASILSFALFPLWTYAGMVGGIILFGRNPKQTGVVGLMR